MDEIKTKLECMNVGYQNFPRDLTSKMLSVFILLRSKEDERLRIMQPQR